MEKICPKCAADPTAHSFKKVSDKGGVVLFYTHPSKAKYYNDTEGILAHIDNTIALIGNKKWKCVIDGDGFDLKHATEVKLGHGLINLLMTKYGHTVQELIIINPTWHIEGLLKLVSVIMNKETFAKIKLLDDRQRSILEFI